MDDSEPTPIAVAVVQHAGRVLVGRRPAGVPLAGLEEFPGGKIRRGDTSAEAAARECLEETGLAVRIGDQLAEVVYRYDHGSVRLHFLAAEPLDGAAEPRAPFRWVPLGELVAEEFPRANAKVIHVLRGQHRRARN